jgi:tRNA(Ile)-lysidine synthase
VLKAFKSHIKKKFPELLKAPFLLACSGGIDSMVRGAESDADEKWIGNLAGKLNKQLFLKRFKTVDYSKERKVSIQMAARELRYAWFAEIMQKNGFKTLVTAHHADDDLETFLINLSRGTGIEGLTGIPEKTDSIARPLLAFSKEQINAYADGENIQWREDRSNADTKYLRNNIRHRILPLFKELNPSFLENFRETQHYLAQTAAIADDGIRQIRGEIFLQEGKTLKIPVRALKKLKPSQGYLYGLFKEYGFTEWNDVEHLLQAMSGKEVRSKTHRLVKDRDFLLLAEIKAVESGAYEIWEHETEIEKPVPMEIEMVNTMTETGEHILYVPKKALKYPLTLRKWEEGDYFYPFGMQGKKKLSKFFKDEKIDVITKEGQWLLCSEGEIVWVVGRRADERFKITEGTEQILKFELKS